MDNTPIRTAVDAAPAPAAAGEKNEVLGPTKFTVTLNKGQGDVVGLDVDWGDMDKLRITKIKEGLMAKWNAVNPTLIVKVGDYIIDINGTNGDAKALLEVVKASSRLDMTI